jgi:hypothetical protein
MKSVGGYFELELRKGTEYHPQAIRLNSGRNAFRYVLEAKKYKKVYLPFYSCDVLLEPIAKLDLRFEYYSVNRDFEPEFDFSQLDSGDCFLYTNYFGLKDDYVKSLAGVCKNLIVDNAQAFFATPVEGVDTFYSPRKFFGVPDGGYLYTNELNNRKFSKDVSYDRAAHLLIRSDLTAEDGYSVFLENEKRFCHGDIRLMSSLTENILKSIDYERVAAIRKENFLFLQERLKDLNGINIEANQNQVPLSYPFYAGNCGLRKRLIESKIYTAQYWANVLENVPNDSIEFDYTENLIHLPIDQRVTIEDLNRIIEIIKL